MRRLEIKRTLGGGGFGTIYLAKLVAERGFERRVAVKVLRRDDGHLRADWRARLRDEARLMGLLQDEHIVGVLELVAIGERDAVLMDYVEGVDLHRLRSKGFFLPPRVLAEVGAVIAGTLHRMHTACAPNTGEPLAVVHRDIKPGNVMLTVHGSPRLLDFGVARAVFEGRESTTNDLVLGSAAYWAPEYCKSVEVTPALDVYALGLTLAMAAGEGVLRPSVAKAEWAGVGIDEFLQDLGPEYGPLRAVLGSALAFEPMERLTGEALARQLQELAEQLPGPSLRSWASEHVPLAMSTTRPHSGGGSSLGEFQPGQELEVADSPIEAITNPHFDLEFIGDEQDGSDGTVVDVSPAPIEPPVSGGVTATRVAPLQRFVFFALLGFAITVVALAILLGS